MQKFVYVTACLPSLLPKKHSAISLRKAMVDFSSADFVNVIPLRIFGLELKAFLELFCVRAFHHIFLTRMTR